LAALYTTALAALYLAALYTTALAALYLAALYLAALYLAALYLAALYLAIQNKMPNEIRQVATTSFVPPDCGRTEANCVPISVASPTNK
jgi:hypothetical protein